jgi:hypothetical protein
MKSINVSFNEGQRIDQWWLKAILVATLGVIGYAVYSFLQKDADVMGHIVFWLGTALGLAAIGLVWFWKLTTRIDNYGIHVKCPFVNKKVNWEEIEELEVINYGFVGGWGIRMWTKFGTVYNTSGSIGLRVKLKSGKKLLIGTQKENELKSIVEKWGNTSF